MIQLPDVSNAYAYENSFYLTCQPGRMGKLLAHHELYKIASQHAGRLQSLAFSKGLYTSSKR
jgi:hypothetical protein